MKSDRGLTTDDRTTNDPKTTVGFSLRRSLVDKLRAQAIEEDVSISALASRILKTYFEVSPSTGN